MTAVTASDKELTKLIWMHRTCHWSFSGSHRRRGTAGTRRFGCASWRGHHLLLRICWLPLPGARSCRRSPSPIETSAGAAKPRRACRCRPAPFSQLNYGGTQ